MGAGLAAQRGWPERDEPPSPQSSQSTTVETTPLTSSASACVQTGDTHFSERAGGGATSNSSSGNFDQHIAVDDGQPLEVGDDWDYHTASGIQSLVPVERQNSGRGEDGVCSHVATSARRDEPDVAYELETPRESRGPSVAYDLGTLSTEDEVRVIVRARVCVYKFQDATQKSCFLSLFFLSLGN